MFDLASFLLILSSLFHPYQLIARGDRMKQAQADADELIAAYRREQQDAFDKKVAMDGKATLCLLHWNVCSLILCDSLDFISCSILFNHNNM